METSLYLASIFGPLMLAIGIGLIVNAGMYRKMVNDFLNESIAIYVSAVGGFVVGLLMIYSHNIWEASWVVVITLVAWMIFIKSALLLVVPKIFESIVRDLKFSDTLIQTAGVFYTLVGLFLCFKSFM